MLLSIYIFTLYVFFCGGVFVCVCVLLLLLLLFLCVLVLVCVWFVVVCGLLLFWSKSKTEWGPEGSTNKGVNQRSKDVTQMQQQKPASPTVTLHQRMHLWWSWCALYLLVCQVRVTVSSGGVSVPCILFTCMPSESYCKRLRSLTMPLCWCDVFQVLINSLVSCFCFVSIERDLYIIYMIQICMCVYSCVCSCVTLCACV